MDNDLSDWLGRSLLPLAGLLAVGVVIRKGYAAADALDAGPRRRVGLGLVDLAIGGLLYLVGMTAAVTLMLACGLVDRDRPPVDEVSEQAYLWQMLIVQLVSQLPVVVYLVLRVRRSARGLAQVGLWPIAKPVRDARWGLMGSVIAVMMVFGLNALMVTLGELLSQPAPDTGHEMLSQMAQAQSPWTVVGLIISAVVFAPLFEECMFRGLVQTGLAHTLAWEDRWRVVLLASVLFVAVHHGMPWQVLPGIFLLSVILGWLYERTGSLWPSILVHMGFNGLNVLLQLSL